MRAFARKYEVWYSNFNHGKSGRQNKRNRTLGKKIMRSKLKKETEKLLEDLD